MLLSVGDLRPQRLRVPALPTGEPLLISDSPEYVKTPGLLAQDTVPGAVRVLYHHVNATTSPLVGAVAVRNPGPLPMWVAPDAQGTCAGADYMRCGAESAAAFLRSDAGAPPVWLQPGEWTAWSSRPLVPGELWSALIALDLSGPAEIYTLMLPPGPLPDPHRLPLLPPFGPQARGIQDAAERWLVLRHRVSAGPAGLQLANPPAGAARTWAEPLPGEYLASRDPGTRTVTVIPGNYGVTYRLGLLLSNDTVAPATVQIALNPRGGPYFGPLSVAGQVYLPPRPVAPGDEAWAPVAVNLLPGETRWVPVRFVPAGASFLPVRLLLIPVATTTKYSLVSCLPQHCSTPESRQSISPARGRRTLRRHEPSSGPCPPPPACPGQAPYR